MESILGIAEIIWKIGGAFVVLLIIFLLIYVIRLVFIAKGILGGVKKTVDTAQQSILSPLGMIGSLFGSVDEELDEDDL